MFLWKNTKLEQPILEYLFSLCDRGILINQDEENFTVSQNYVHLKDKVIREFEEYVLSLLENYSTLKK